MPRNMTALALFVTMTYIAFIVLVLGLNHFPVT